MHSKLNLKVHGVRDLSDLKIIEENFKLQDAIKDVNVFQSKKFVEIKLDIDETKISKQQVMDIIKISGDFTVEEYHIDNNKVKDDNKSNSDGVYTASGSELSNQKMSLIGGAMFGALLISILLNLVFGYALFGNNKISELLSSADEQNVEKVQIGQNNPGAQQALQPSPQVVAPVQEFNITKNDNVRGKFNAPITLVQYSDFECPFSGRAYPTFKKLLSDYPDKVRLVYKHFPLSFHTNAQKAAESAECAGEQGKFWEYHDKLFENQSGGLSVVNFKQWAGDLNLNTNKFNNCLDSGKYASKVQADEADGQKRGVQGTPATFVNGQLVSGAVPYENFKTVIDQILNKN